MTMETTEAVPASSSEGGSDPEALGGSPISTRGMGDPASASTRKGSRARATCITLPGSSRSLGKPVCVGVSRTLQQVPGYIVGESELEASKEGRNLSDFKYSCVGYSVFMDSNNGESDKGEHKAELPFCVGIELLVDRRVSAPDHTPVHASNRDDSIHQQQPQKSPHSIGEEFLSRFSRNAGLVASGVSRNLQRAAHYVKDNLDDILYPDRRRPK